MRRTGDDAPEHEFGRVYVQGLKQSDDQEIYLLFDKLPTPGGDHCQTIHRIFAPLGREVWKLGGGSEFVYESEWPEHAARQIQLLITAGIPREKAEAYYAEKANR